MKKGITSKIIFALIVAAFVVVCFIQSPITSPANSLWSLLPPVVAIGLALITKEVYSSLFIGIVAGALIHTNFNIVNTLTAIFEKMTEKEN